MLLTPFHPFPVLHTERLVLRKLRLSDLPEIFFLRSDKRMLQFLDRDADASELVSEKWLKMVLQQQRKNKAITWGMVPKGERKIVGTICFWNLQMEHYRAEIGYGLHPEFQGIGLMNEAMKVVLKFGFEQMKLHSVEANINPANASSAALLKRNHFVQEACFKENFHHNGRFLDSAIYSLLVSRWKP